MQDIFKMTQNIGITLTEQQKHAVLHKDGPALVLAVPGAGKTTVMICRTMNLLASNIKASEILSITFSRSAANEMRNKFSSLFGNYINSSSPKFSTIHSFSYHIIRSNKKDYQLIENSEAKKVLSNLYHNINNEYIKDDQLDDLINRIGYVKNMMININDIDNDEYSIDNFKFIMKNYEDYKTKKSLIDFDDMLCIAYKMLVINSKLLNSYRDRYKYIQIDEGQDTSKIQHEIIKLISYPLNNIFIVADDDQSIYGFRGAYPQMILNFKKNYNKAKLYFMEENFRSTKIIVNASNKFISQNKTRYKKNLVTNNPYGIPINFIERNDEKDEADDIVNQLSNDIDHISSYAILYRNNISSVVIADKLIAKHIPFIIKDTNLSFFFSWVLSDMIAFLKFTENQNDMDSFEKIYYKLGLYISRENLYELKKISNNKPILKNTLHLEHFNKKQTDKANELLYIFRKMKTMVPSDAIDCIINEINYIKNLPSDTVSIDNVKALISAIKAISENDKTLSDLICHLNHLYKAMKSSPSYNLLNAVTLSTIHSAKGMEFNNVIIIDVNDGVIPSNDSLKSGNDAEESLEEERRLFYVGITRAKQSLTLYYTKKRGDENSSPSMFYRQLYRFEQDRIDWIKKNQKRQGIRSKLNKLIPGIHIKHKYYGSGLIKSVTKGNSPYDNVICVLFNNGSERKISAGFCIDNDIIEII